MKIYQVYNMKDISNLETDITRIFGKVTNGLIEVQREAAENIMNDAKLLAPGEGLYRDSIKVSDTKVTENSIETEIYTDMMVGSEDGKKYNLGYLLENGTDPHTIVPKNAKALMFQVNGETVFTKKVNHPGTKPQPHFIPALQKNKLKYKKEIIKSILRGDK